MEKQSLSELLQDLEQELLRLKYTEGSMKFYNRRWQQLKDFAQTKGEIHYTEQLGMDFVLDKFGITQEDFGKTLSQAQTQELRIIRMIGDFQLHRSILRRYMKHKEILTDPFFLDVRMRFMEYCSQKEYSKVTAGHYEKQSAYFMDYLAAHNIKKFDGVTLDLINTYIRTLAGFTYKTVEQNICSLRAFFRFLYQTGMVQTDFASKMPMVKARKQTTIPAVWGHEELEKLISAIDRGSPKGKRDYAIILIACRLGIRCADIKNLCFENFNWTDKKLSLMVGLMC